MPAKPFPWYCSRCKTATVELCPQRYEFVQSHDGRQVPIVIEDLPIPTCSTCGRQTLAESTLQRITAETYRQLGLLKPGEIRSRREALGLKQQQIQSLLGLGGNTVSRWENGHIYQSRALDRFLRLYFADESVRTRLEIDDWSEGPVPSERSFDERFPSAATHDQRRRPSASPGNVLVGTGDSSQ